MAVHRETPRCWDVTLVEDTRLLEHRPFGISAACVLPNGVKISAGVDGELNAFNPNNLAQFTTRVNLMPNGTERITMLYAWDAWDEFAPAPPASGPRWYVAIVVTQDPMRWFMPNAKRHASRLLVWNVKTGQVAALNGTHPQASHAAQITHLAHYRNILISGCQDGSVLAWDPSFPVGPMVMLNDQRYDEGVEVNVIAGLHCVDDESLNAGGSGGPVALAVLYNGGVIVWNLWEMLRLARGARDLRLPAPALDPVATGMMGAEGDRVKDTELTRTDPLPPAVAHWRLLALVVPAGSPSARIRHFTIQEFVIQRKFIEIPMNFLSSMRIAACPYAVCVVGAGLITIIQQSGYGDRGWDAADLLEAASKGGVALDYDDPLAIGDMRNSAPRVYRWFDERLTARTMGDAAAILASTAADGASCTVFVRLLERVIAFTTQLDEANHKKEGVLLPHDIVEGQPTVLLSSGYGSDDEEDMFVGDSEGNAVIVDTRSLQEPTRLTHVSFFDILPAILNFVAIAVQISALSFLARNQLPWGGVMSAFSDVLRFSIADVDVDVRSEFPWQFLVMAVLGVFGVVAAIIYQRYEVRKPVSRIGEAQTNTRLDDSACMRFLWWAAWLSNDILFIPILRTMLAPMDCDSHANGTSWALDRTQGPNYKGDTPCFEGDHWLYFWGGFVLMLPIGAVALRLSPLSGDVSHMLMWWDWDWMWRTGDRAFLGIFTRNAITANATSFSTFVIKISMLFAVTVFGRWQVAVTIVLTLLALLLMVVGALYPTYESEVMNRALTGAHFLCLVTSFCAFLTAVVDDPTQDWTGIIVLVCWGVAVLAAVVVALRGLSQCICRRPAKPQRADGRGSKIGRRNSLTYAGHLQNSHAPGTGMAGVTVGAGNQSYEYRPLLPFPQVKEWSAISPWDPANWFKAAQAAHQAAANKPAAEGGAGAGAGAGAGGAGGFKSGVWNAVPSHQDANTLAAEVRAQVAAHEAERTSLQARLALERRRQRAKALNRKKARSAKKRGVAPAPEPAAPGGTTEDAQAAMEWVYAEHDAQMQGLKARMEAERIEQRARMEARLKARKERQASERSAQ